MDPAWVAPVFTVEYMPDASPGSEGDGGSVGWVTLGQPTSLYRRRGRPDQLSRMEPATCTLTFEPGDDSLDVLLSGAVWQPDAPVRVTALYDGVTYEVWHGYAEDSPAPAADLGAGRPWVVECTDLIGWGAQIDLPGSKWASAIAEASPVVWIRGEMSRSPGGNGDEAFNVASPSLGSGAVVSGANAGRQTSEQAPVTPGSSHPAVGVFASDQFLRVPDVFGSHTSDAEFTVAAALECPAPTTSPQYLLFGRDTSNTGTWSVWVTSFGPAISAELRNTSGTVLATATVGLPVGEPFFLRAVFNRSPKRVELHVDADSGSFSQSSTSASGTTAAIGGPRLDLGHSSMPHWPRWADVAAFRHNDFDWDAGWDGPLWEADTITQRVGRLARMVDMHGGVLPAGLSAPSVQLGGHDPGGSLGAALLDLGESFGGATWVNPDGEVVIRTGAQIAADNDPVWQLTDRPSPSGSEEVVRYEARGRTGARAARVINEASVTWRGGVLRARAPWSMVSGVRSWSRDSNAYSATDVVGVPDALVDRYASPQVELGEVTIRPWGDDAATRMALGMPLLAPVRFVETSPATGAVAIDATCRVQADKWDWSNGTDWTVSYQLEPLEPLS